ncbi:putative RNA polymerase II transcriptional coactivator [Colletotrichum sidae]|uniref:RNA polymerase II transcriptional coactivator n=3 Tax=Colletotrichum orbiculare species complex TaxID=2707354 RepID=N4VHH5_COLOR|nr:putative RNA polymerase II transcriptional coactivator [Colletotrichum orbiculare MAFF 240422]TDZ27441.1 putative RNA polymerase II transcriptional coactivator [Colletotrichum spinosum]TEA20513.1 putative RNA polymerase II transcriptional coactivator [Colletotrichum sidae]
MPFSKGTKRDARNEEDDEVVTSKPTKKTKTSTDGTTGGGLDKDGNPYWDLSKLRRIGVSKFKETTLVNIREFYEKDGNLLPGKKGISLSLPQYEALLKAIPDINAKLREMGHSIKDVEEDTAAKPKSPAAAKPKEKSGAKKANIEATSDEESE